MKITRSLLLIGVCLIYTFATYLSAEIIDREKQKILDQQIEKQVEIMCTDKAHLNSCVKYIQETFY